MLTATLGAQCMLWQTSPAATELETRVLDWLRQMIGLPDGFAGVIQDSASSATLCAVLVARERATDWQANEQGLEGGPQLCFYASEEAHSSIEKAIRIAGLGRQSLRLIATDADFAMRPEALEAAIRADLANGLRPAGVIATLGTTGVGAIDPLRPIGALCREHGLYLHVDAAWAGSALLLDEQRWMTDGIEAADSFVFNPHKWLLTNFDCSAHFVRDPAALIRTLSILPAYLKSEETGQVIDYRDWSVPLGRRFRALKLWFVIRSYGVERLQAMLRDHIAWTAELAEMDRRRARLRADLAALARPALVPLPATAVDGEEQLDRLNERLLHGAQRQRPGLPDPEPACAAATSSASRSASSTPPAPTSSAPGISSPRPPASCRTSLRRFPRERPPLTRSRGDGPGEDRSSAPSISPRPALVYHQPHGGLDE